MERVLGGLISAYNSPTNLVLVIGATAPELTYVTERLHELGYFGTGPQVGVSLQFSAPYVLTVSCCIFDE